MTGASGPVDGPGPVEECAFAGVAVAHEWAAAEPDDEERLREHLPCPVCEAASDAAQTVADALAGAVPLRDPPEALRERVIAAVAAAGPRAPVEDAPPEPEPAVLAAAGEAIGLRRRGAGALLLTAAVVLGVVLLAGRAFMSGPAGTPPDATGVPPDPASLAASASRVVADARERDPGVRSAVLRDADGRAVAVALEEAGSPSPRVVPLDLAAPPPGRTWVLWGTGAGPPASLGAVDRGSGRSVGSPSGPPPGGWRGFAVSTEPAGATAARPTDVLARGAVA